jgi:methyl-accepting chemotaxis protein
MSIRKKLLLIALAALLGLGAIFIVNKIGQTHIATSVRGETSMLQAEIAMLQARRAEKNFLDRRDMSYAERQAQAIADAKAALAACAEADPELAEDIAQADTLLDDYQGQFSTLVLFMQSLGLNENEGLQGDLRAAIHEVEKALTANRSDALMAAMLSLRRHEKDFIMRGDPKYLDKFSEGVDAMYTALDYDPYISRDGYETIASQLDAYAARFAEFGRATLKLQEAQARFIEAVRKSGDVMDALVVRTRELTARDTGRLELFMLLAEAAIALALVGAIVLVARSISGGLGRLQKCSRDIAGGDYAAASRERFSGELEALRQDLEAMVDKLVQSMEEAEAKSRQAEEQAGHARQAMEEAGREKEHATALMDTMGEVAQRAAAIAEDLAGAARELEDQGREIARGTDRQRDHTRETATAMEEMTATVMEVARNAAQSAEGATRARAKADEGAALVAEVVDASGQVSARTGEMKTSLAELARRVESIGQIMDVITDIADQTNLLALNAAIEAARAGDAGRGFAVVADEVRKLAEKTMTATREVGQAIAGVQEGSAANIRAMDGAGEAVTYSTELTHKAGGALKEIVTIIAEAADRIGSIATAAEQQSAASEEINRSVEEVAEIAAQTSEGMARSAEAIRHVASLSEDLKGLIDELNATRR